MSIPSDNLCGQSLLLLPWADKSLEAYPPIRRSPEAVRDIAAHARPDTPIGLDFEYHRGKPTIVSLSTPEYSAVASWREDVGGLTKALRQLAESGAPIVGHSVISADKPLLDESIGRPTPVSQWDDTMLIYYLLNGDLAKGASRDEDDDDEGAMGFMGLWHMAARYTKLPQWKKHRGRYCWGPCPQCDPFGYCAVDSWAALICYHRMKAELSKWKVSWDFVREIHDLAYICWLMEQKGVQVDKSFIAELDQGFDALRESLFPSESGPTLFDTGTAPSCLFNPRSPKQVKEWFAERDVVLKSAEKEEVRKALLRMVKRRGYLTIEDYQADTEDGLDEPNEALEALCRLYEYKSAGKGTGPWFDAKYFDKDGVLHPRFNVVGTSTGRLSSSKPNFQNMGARGSTLMQMMRKAVVAREGYQLVKADFSQLELRMCLHLSGVDSTTAGTDAFTWLVHETGDTFTAAAKVRGMKPRDVAKSVSHAGDYLEGLTLLTPDELACRGREIEAGALEVYPDWRYRGRIVAFTGGNLAERLFGSKSWPNRKRALDVQAAYFNRFPSLRQWQRRALAEIEAREYVRLQTSRFRRLYTGPEDDAKEGVATLGQGNSAEHVCAIMLRYYRETGEVPLLQVHDELVWELPLSWKDDTIRQFLGLMTQTTKAVQGFRAPIKACTGAYWLERDMRKVEVPFD